MRFRPFVLLLVAALAACGRGALLPADQPPIEVPASSPADIRAGIVQGLADSGFTVDTEAKGEIVARYAEKGRSVIVRVGYSGERYAFAYVFSTGFVMKRDSANAVLIEDRYRSLLAKLAKKIDHAIRQPKVSPEERQRAYDALPGPALVAQPPQQPAYVAVPQPAGPAGLQAGSALVSDKPLSEVSDADRHAARDLYREGFSLQQAGKHAEALEKFTRSFRVYGAPTTGLRIAECQAMLGKLVEAAEIFRAVQAIAVPPGNAAFDQAKQQAAAELQQVEARMPRLTIEVTPASVRNLTVTIDGQPMSAALVGVPRPINPGPHTIVATAPNYKIAEAQVDIKEKERSTVTLALKR